MVKIFGVIAIIILSIGAFYWWRNPHIVNKLSPFPTFFSPKDILGKTSLQKIPENLADDFVENTKQSLYQNARSVLVEVFDQKEDSSSNNSITVVVNPTTTVDDILVIDFSKDNNLQIKIAKNIGYQLKFKNTPANFCLYIDADKYQIDDSKTIELQFTKGGSYAVKANLCDLKDLNLGQIIVE